MLAPVMSALQRTFRFAIAISGLLIVAPGCQTTPDNPPAALHRFEFSQPQMGLPFRIVLYARDAAQAEAAANAAFARIAQLNGILSDYDTDSELSQLSRTSGQGKTVPLSADLWLVLARAQKFSADTDGAFDITVGPFVNLWRKARREQKLPRADLLAEATRSVGWRKLQLDARSRTATLVAPNMRLDLGSIAKGYAIDEALHVLGRRGIRSALVTGGGDMAASAPPPDRAGWRITLAPLDVTNAPPARQVLLKHAGLGTSGDLFQHVEIDGIRYSHIVNPHTGYGLTDHSLVTVIARDCITANTAATAVSVMGPERGLRLVASLPDAALHYVRKPASHIEHGESSRLRDYLEPPQPK
jgi:FAD:protein FMN transferase